jgi:hypothetical protein
MVAGQTGKVLSIEPLGLLSVSNEGDWTVMCGALHERAGGGSGQGAYEGIRNFKCGKEQATETSW